MRNKLLAVLIFLLFAISICVIGDAAQMEFREFTVEVPEGWAAQQKGSTVVISANDNSAAITVTLDSSGGMSLEETAKAFAKELNGSNLRLEADVYRFNFKNERGVDSIMLISGEGNKYTAVSITGDHPEVKVIIDSLRAK